MGRDGVSIKIQNERLYVGPHNAAKSKIMHVSNDPNLFIEKKRKNHV